MQTNDSFWFSPKGAAAIVIIACPTYFLFMEHREHVFQYLPYLILLLCPLMHLFMHHGHGSHDGKNNDSSHALDEGSVQNAKAYRQGYKEAIRDANEKSQHH